MRRFSLLLLALLLCTATTPLAAQGLPRPVIRNSNVGYLDTAIPGNQLRFQFDSAFDLDRPSRGDFFWSPGGTRGTGPDRPETGVDYRDVTVYAESLLAPRLAAFVNVPLRFLNPEQNDNAWGLAELQGGLKYALYDDEASVLSAQFRTSIPSSNAGRGLGSDHVSIEPGLLYFRQLSPGWAFEAEVRDWIPLDGTNIAGNVLRYGLGLSYQLASCGDWQLAPVGEVVGWTFLSGSEVTPTGPTPTRPLADHTILNAKLGVRLKHCDDFDVYLGYGRPVTGSHWYEHIVRLELRFFF